jgi:GT2 family glycosyltransferase
LGFSTFSIIIPTYQSTHIQETISAIDCYIHHNYLLDVLIVGEQDDLFLPDNSKYYSIRVDKNPSPARNRNAGASMAKGEWLVFFDSDCIPLHNWFDKILESLGNDNIYVGSIDLDPRMPYWSWCDHLLSFNNQINGISKKKFLNYAASNNLVVRKNLFIDLGGFDESFSRPAGEDYDFCVRAGDLGQKIVYVNEAVVIHNHKRKNFRDSWNHLYTYGESTIQRRYKNKSDYDFYHKWIYTLLRIKIVGEVIGLCRVFGRGFLRPLLNPALTKFWKYFPGMILLDIAHTSGMIKYLRSHRQE